MLSLIISTILFFILNQFNFPINLSFQKAILKAGFIVNSENQNNIGKMNLNLGASTEENWYLEIPKIHLKANIKEGTTKEIMDQFIGHFEESKKWAGNVCLAAHNRGYENNYFSEIKKLKEGDTIFYYYQENSKEYLVEKNDIIQDIDLSCLENTEDNTITLITCVENEPNYRRCVRAIEKIN